MVSWSISRLNDVYKLALLCLAWPGTLLHTFSEVRFLLAYIIVVLFNKWPVTDCLGSKFTRKHYHDIHLELT